MADKDIEDSNSDDSRGRVMNFTKEEREYFEKNSYNLQSWVHNIIDKAIILDKEKNEDALRVLQREIDGTKKPE